MKKSTSKLKNEPVDVSNFTTLEDLIHAAMGPPDKNIVNFKMVQAILMILAQQLRMLKRPVDYRSLEEDKTIVSEREGEEGEKSERDGREGEKAETESRKSVEDGREGEKLEKEGETSKRDEGKGGKSEKDEGKGEKAETGSTKSVKDERNGEKSDRKGEKSKRDEGKGEKSERDGGKGEKAETGSTKSVKDEREGEKSETKGETSKRDEGKGEKSEGDGEKVEKAETESTKSMKDGREGEKSEKKGEKSKRDERKGEISEKDEGKGEKSERDGGKGEKAETESTKSIKDGREGEKSEKKGETSKRDEGKGGKSEKDEGKGEKAETGSTKSVKDERDGEKSDRKGEKSKRDEGKGEKSERDGGKGEKAETGSTKSVKDEREGEKSETKGEKSKRDEGKGEKSERDEGKGEKSERDGGKGEKAETESTKSVKDGREGEKSEKKGEKSKRDEGKGEKSERGEGKGEKSERDGGKGEKTGTESRNSVKDEEESERKSETSERGSKRSETESEKSRRESERSETESEKSRRESEKSERVSEKAERALGKTEQERKKAARIKVKPARLREKTSRDGEEKEKNMPLIEKAVSEKEVKQKPVLEESFISITDKDKVLVVEKIPTSRRDSMQSRVGSIHVVTLSQFKILEAAVKALEEKSSPIPFPSMPDNRTLRDELARGNANLSDAMNTMQVAARVQAAEEAINRMAEILTDIATESVVPSDLADKTQSVTGDAKTVLNSLEMLQEDKSDRDEMLDRKDKPSATSKRAASSVKGVGKASKSSVFSAKGKGTPKGAKQATAESGAKRESKAPRPLTTSMAKAKFVTHPQMNEALRALKDSFSKSAYTMSACANKITDQSRSTVNTVAEKAALVSVLDDRIKATNKKLDDHGELIAVCDANVVSQMDAFNTQLGLVKNDLHDGMVQFESMDVNLETQAVKELNEKYNKLVEMLDMTIELHRNLVAGHNDMNNDMKTVLNCIEMLQEDKSDRDEMLDRLQDKADISSLDHLLPLKQFAVQQEILNEKLERCKGKFERQESVWQSALEDLAALSDEKSDFLLLLRLKEETEKQLNEINKKLRCLTYALGEPKAALLARKLSLGALCGSCKRPALQEAVDKSYMRDSKNKLFSKPARLPSAYFSYMGAGDPCDVETNAPTAAEAQQHVCQRWVGGSHTLISASVKRIEAEPLQPIEAPTKKYTEYGDDGKLYNMEKPLDPCESCNLPDDDELRVDGAGDTDHMVHGHHLGGSQNADK